VRNATHITRHQRAMPVPTYLIIAPLSSIIVVVFVVVDDRACPTHATARATEIDALAGFKFEAFAFDGDTILRLG